MWVRFSRKKNILAILLFGLVLNIQAQKISIHAENKPLNEVLIEIRDTYHIDLSFNNSALSVYRVHVNREFKSPENAFRYLLSGLPYKINVSNNVYVFVPVSKAKRQNNYILSGLILDAESKEHLPYCHVFVNDVGIVSDESGNFKFQSNTDSVFHVKILYLGYHQLDTLVFSGNNYQFNLIPGLVSLKQVNVKANPVYFASQTGSQAGLVRINHQIARFIPGNGDNSIFNLLRLQPGVLASGEQSSDLIIWGSYQGESQINFDDITMFGLKNFNDNISKINPYFTKDIRVYKGGYNATLGERVGGIVDITGINGNSVKPGVNIDINNNTFNILAETPLNSNISVAGAIRKTYYDLYNASDIQLSNTTSGHFSDNTIAANPEYKFTDANFKISGNDVGGNSFRVSSFWGGDDFSYSVDQDHGNMNIKQELSEQNTQYGVNVHYNKLWKGSARSKLSFSYSALEKFKHDIQSTTSMDMMGTGDTGMGMGSGMGGEMDNTSQNMHSNNTNWENQITELKAFVENVNTLNNNNNIQWGIGLVQNTAKLNDSALIIENLAGTKVGNQFVNYIHIENTSINYLSIKLGLRNNFISNVEKIYLQPRLGVSFQPFNNYQMNISWGIYNQLISQSSIVDEYNNYSYLWSINSQDASVLKSNHMVFGNRYYKNGFLANVEFYNKQTDGVSRYIIGNNTATNYIGKSKSRGVDIFVKQEYRGQTIWVSYSLSETKEWFPYFADTGYRNSIQDQRHELKLAGIASYKNWSLSVNYVYGSGFELPVVNNEAITKYPYKRFDAAAIYHFSGKRINMEAGFSVLNFFARQNIKFVNLVQVPTLDNTTLNIYSEAVPFTPTLFLNIRF